MSQIGVNGVKDNKGWKNETLIWLANSLHAKFALLPVNNLYKKLPSNIAKTTTLIITIAAIKKGWEGILSSWF